MNQCGTAAIRRSDLTKDEVKVIEELRRVDWGKVTVVKKKNEIVMITPAPDIKVSKD